MGTSAGLLVDNGTLTVLQALALAGGTNHTAKMGAVRIIRKGPTGMTETRVPLKKMLEAKAPDMNCRPMTSYCAAQRSADGSSGNNASGNIGGHWNRGHRGTPVALLTGNYLRCELGFWIFPQVQQAFEDAIYFSAVDDEKTCGQCIPAAPPRLPASSDSRQDSGWR